MLKRKRNDTLNNAENTIAKEDKENMLDTHPHESSQDIKTQKEQCHLTDSQYDELFQHVLQKSNMDFVEDIGKSLGPFQKVEEQTACSEICVLSQTEGNFFQTVPSVESSTAKKRCFEHTQKEPRAECLKSQKLSLKKRKQKKDQCIAWIQCSNLSCEKWRKLESGIDPSSLPDSWSCSQNTDFNFNNCDIPEECWSGSDDEVIYATFVPGSIVWAKQRGYSWWPGMIEADPDIGVYFLFTSNLDQLPVSVLTSLIDYVLLETI
ncbi:hypothetical protein NDU88_000267 [Pleurodeles waltl]|uniref:Zinc finger CW-type PWWP domain protein 1 n=1 Tax=Pleurodeles waltl TaxID=8319 RepID=A0AAV7KX74_PLEWA|nr:hypothetical protein NDU88_000267 [Pleurodeles waltl]